MLTRSLIVFTLAAAFLPRAVHAQATVDRFPYPGDPAAPAQSSPSAPLIAPKGTLQANPHTAAVHIADPPCLDPAEGSAYGYTQRPGTPDRRADVKAYFWDMRKSIYDHWLLHPPRMAARPWLKKGIVGVKFTIDKDGTVETPFVTLSSPHDGFDEHAVQSLEEMSPLPAPPPGVEIIRACYFFLYNYNAAPTPANHDYSGWQDAH